MLQSTPKNLYTDQEQALELLRDGVKESTKKRVVMQAPTGFGKTLLAATLTDSALKKGKHVLFTVPAISLIDQTVEMFAAQGITEVGVIQQDHVMTNWDQPVQVASVATLRKRQFPKADVILIDEVHRWSSFYEKMLAMPENLKVPIIGLSATPWRKALGKWFDVLKRVSTTEDLIKSGRLSPFVVYAPQIHPDLEGVRSHQTANGLDFVEGEVEERMCRAELVADVVDTWLYRAENRPTLCFAVNCNHARVLAERFRNAGVPTDYQDASTSMLERAAIKARFHRGDTLVVCNVGTLTTGVDWDVRCISMCRPTRSEMLFVQIVGRGLRTAPGKDHCLILDHSDNHLRLGMVTEIDTFHDALHSGDDDAPAGRDVSKVALPKECPNCGLIKPPRTAVCPHCGHNVTAHATTDIEEAEGTLVELTELKKRKGVSGDKKEVYAGLLWIQQHRGYKSGWVSHKYREIFGVWPVGLKFTAPKRPEGDLEEFVRKTNARYALRKNRTEKPQDRSERDEAAIRRVREEFGKPTYTSALMDDDDYEVKL